MTTTADEIKSLLAEWRAVCVTRPNGTIPWIAGHDGLRLIAALEIAVTQIDWQANMVGGKGTIRGNSNLTALQAIAKALKEGA